MDVDKITLSTVGPSTETFVTDYLVMASTHVHPVVDVARERCAEVSLVVQSLFLQHNCLDTFLAMQLVLLPAHARRFLHVGRTLCVA